VGVAEAEKAAAEAARDPLESVHLDRLNDFEAIPSRQKFQGASPGILGVDIGATGANRDADRRRRASRRRRHAGTRRRPCRQARAVNAALLAEIIFKSNATTAFVEHVGARPGEGPTGAFAFGRARGVIEGVLAAAGVPVAFLTPPSWKRIVGIPPGREGAKDAARSEAIRRWPAHAGLFARVKDDGRAEAALIALAGLMREAGR